MKTVQGVAWMNPEQAGMVRSVFAGAGIELRGVGCPDAHQTGRVASELGCDGLDDLRTTLVSAEADVLLIADAGSFGDAEIGQDLEALRAAHARNLAVATLEPIPASAGEVASTDWVEVIHAGVLNAMVRFVPRTVRTAVMVELQTALETFGVIRSCAVSVSAPAWQGSLGARLFDGLDLVRALMGVPETVDASYVAPAAVRGMHALPGRSLRDLHGSCTMNLRYGDGRAASMLVSDRAGARAVSVVAMGAEGHIVVDDAGFRWFNRSGEVVDSFSTEPEGDGTLTKQLVELCSGVGPKHAPVDYAANLSMTHAALLSTRTGQGETPESIRRLLLEV